jgi:hypothetical protein
MNSLLKKNFLLFFFFLFSILVQATELDVGDMIELSGTVNGRGSANFKKESHNIKKLLPKGTHGVIEKKTLLPSGNFGLKINVTEGKYKKKSFWVYYNLKKPKVILSTSKEAKTSDFEKSELITEKVEDAKSLKLTADQEALAAKKETTPAETLVQNVTEVTKDLSKGPNISQEESCSDCVDTKEEEQKKVADITTSNDALMNNYTKLGGDPTALKQALCFYHKNQNASFKCVGELCQNSTLAIHNKKYITINDQNKDSDMNRLFILNLETNKVESYFTGHGYGDKKAVDSYTPTNPGNFKYNPNLKTDQFSNKHTSFLTPRGFFLTGYRSKRDPTKEKPWTFDMKLYGLQKNINDESLNRFIEVHPFNGTNNNMASSDKDNTPIRSDNSQPLMQGCVNLPPDHASKIIDDIKEQGSSSGGSLYYNYTPTEKEAGDQYCGESGLMYKK